MSVTNEAVDLTFFFCLMAKGHNSCPIYFRRCVSFVFGAIGRFFSTHAIDVCTRTAGILSSCEYPAAKWQTYITPARLFFDDAPRSFLAQSVDFFRRTPSVSVLVRLECYVPESTHRCFAISQFHPPYFFCAAPGIFVVLSSVFLSFRILSVFFCLPSQLTFFPLGSRPTC